MTGRNEHFAAGTGRYTFVHTPESQHRNDMLQAMHDGKEAGHIIWTSVGAVPGWPDDERGKIGSVEVHPDHQRRGLGTELFQRARQIEPKLHHSEALSDDADHWIAGMSRKQER